MLKIIQRTLCQMIVNKTPKEFSYQVLNFQFIKILFSSYGLKKTFIRTQNRSFLFHYLVYNSIHDRHNGSIRCCANFLFQMHRKLLLRSEALETICTFRLDFQVGKFMPFEIEFVFERGAAFLAGQTYVFLHVQCEMRFQRELFLTAWMLAVKGCVDAVLKLLPEVSPAVNTGIDYR